VDEEFEFLPIVRVITRVFPVDGRVKPGKILGFVKGRDTSTGKLGRWDTVGKLGLGTIHSILNGFKKEWVID
jgi:hypothetical protein